MRLVVLVLLVNRVISQGVLRTPPCSFAKVLPLGVPRCASIRDPTVKTWPSGMHGEPMLSSRESPLATSDGPALSGEPETHHLGRRALGALFGASALGFPMRYSQAASDIKLCTFDGVEATNCRWAFKADNVMARVSGGLSSAGSSKTEGGKLVLEGSVNPTAVDLSQKVTPSSGFIATQTSTRAFPDISSCEGISLVAKASAPYPNVPDYRICLDSTKEKKGRRGARCWKALFVAPPEFGTVQIPFKDFSSYWDDTTGNIIISCAKNPKWCPDSPVLQNIDSLTFWAEGTKGNAKLEVKDVSAYGCSAGVSLIEGDSVGGASEAHFFWSIAAASAMLLMFFIGRNRTRPTPVAAPLLG